MSRMGKEIPPTNEKSTAIAVLSLAEKERFELSRRVNPTYTLSRGASSAS